MVSALGCPDVSLLPELSDIFNVDLSEMLSGKLIENDIQGGNMKRIKFYVCPNCENVLTALTDTSISCCGKKLTPLKPKKASDSDKLSVEVIFVPLRSTPKADKNINYLIS